MIFILQFKYQTHDNTLLNLLSTGRSAYISTELRHISTFVLLCTDDALFLFDSDSLIFVNSTYLWYRNIVEFYIISGTILYSTFYITKLY
jgi:hypothetical protein